LFEFIFTTNIRTYDCLLSKTCIFQQVCQLNNSSPS